jgi:hypothetical protein
MAGTGRATSFDYFTWPGKKSRASAGRYRQELHLSFQCQNLGFASPHNALLFLLAQLKSKQKKIPQCLARHGTLLYGGAPAQRSAFVVGQKLAALRQFVRIFRNSSKLLRRR